MKKKNILLIMLLVLTGFAMQSCKEDEPTIKVYNSAMPSSPIPTNEGILTLGQTNYTLEWQGTDSDSQITWDLYLSTSDKTIDDSLKATGLTETKCTVKIVKGGTYYWRVVTTDGTVKSTSAIWQFQVNSDPTVAIPTPVNNAINVNALEPLKWSCSDAEGDELSYNIFIGKTATELVLVAENLTDTAYAASLDYSTDYYWKIVANDPYGGTSETGVFKFTTAAFVPDWSVFNGMATEVWNKQTHDVNLMIDESAHTITMLLPIADGFVSAGWGTVYSGVHPIVINYDPVTMNVTSAKQAWCDSFVDPKEMGPMSLTVAAGGKIDAQKKKITLKWIVSGNTYWGPDYNIGTTTYTMK